MMGRTTVDRPEGLDVARLAAWLHEAGIADGTVRDMRPLAGGTQNLILRLTAGDRDLVLRRPPPDRASGEKTIRREAVILAALGESGLPHARFRGLCEDKAILGGVFLVTDEVKGFNATVEMPGRAGSDPSFRYGMGIALVEGLAVLAQVRVGRGPIAALGAADGFVERQVGRWASQLAGYAELSGWPGPAGLGPVDAIGEWLSDNLPSDRRAGLMHGDYHIANVLFRHDDGGLAAVLDWELAAIGDPLLDLARLITVWPNARNESLLSLAVEPWDGFPPVEALIDRYAALTGRSMASLRWFEVLACYKFGIILEGTHARAHAGHADPGVGARLHTSAKGLIAHAARLLDRS